MLVSRLFNTGGDATAAVNDLRQVGFRDVAITTIAKTTGDVSTTYLLNAGIAATRAESYASSINTGKTLVIVDAPVGSGPTAKEILERSRPGDSGDHPAEYEVSPRTMTTTTTTTGAAASSDEPISNVAAPLSAKMNWPVLLDDPAPLSRWMGWRTLSDPPTTKPTSHGFAFLSPDPTPLSSKFGWKVLSDDPTPFSNKAGRTVLSDDPTPLSTKMGYPVLSYNPTPLSSWLGWTVLLKDRSAK